MDIDPKAQERSVRTLIVSDVHLGCRYAQAENFLAYLRGVRPEQLFILGDFLDGWKLRSGWRWNATYSGYPPTTVFTGRTRHGNLLRARQPRLLPP